MKRIVMGILALMLIGNAFASDNKKPVAKAKAKAKTECTSKCKDPKECTDPKDCKKPCKKTCTK
jgi:hypothetical protein